MTPIIELSLFSSRLAALCEEMGASLQRAAFSPNIKDRLDFSCAVFDAHGHLCAQAAHIPVHLGSMAYAMVDLVAAFAWRHGDVLVVNDPYLGGTHLPDVTVVAPVFVDEALVDGVHALPDILVADGHLAHEQEEAGHRGESEVEGIIGPYGDATVRLSNPVAPPHLNDAILVIEYKCSLSCTYRVDQYSTRLITQAIPLCGRDIKATMHLCCKGRAFWWTKQDYLADAVRR